MLKLKKFKDSGPFILAVLAAAAATVVAAVWLANSLGGSRLTEKCGSGFHASWLMIIKDDKIVPDNLDASRCDRLTIKNMDQRGRLMAFGNHEQHEPYDGIAERFLIQGESFSVTLNTPGSFKIHDHNQASVQARFTVR